MTVKVLLTGLLFVSLIGCKKDDDVDKLDLRDDVPEFFKATDPGIYGQSQPGHFLIAGSSSNINIPQDLDFNPNRINELWIINRDIEATGGSTVMITNTGQSNQATDFRRDGNALHFMSLPTAISFSNNGNWGTSTGVKDANFSGGDFTGPTLWSSDLNIYAKNAGPGTNGSHLDMLHGSPYSMGIESERDNIFWVYDGYNNHIVRYDFMDDHGPGMHDHSDGKIHRYTEVKVKRDPEVPSHMVLDEEKNWLYIVDGGNKRILRLDINSGNKKGDVPLYNELLAEHWEMNQVVWEEFLPASFGLKRPCGIEIHGDRLFISDYETGEIICVNVKTKTEVARINTGAKGLMGITLGPDKRLYYVDSKSNEVKRIDPN